MDVARKNTKFVRVQKGIKREELARSIGISYKTLANFESSNNPISEEYFARIANALGVTSADLFDPDFEQRFKSGLVIPKTEANQTQGGRFSDEASIAEIKAIMAEFDEAERESAFAVLRALRDAHRANASRKRAAG